MDFGDIADHLRSLGLDIEDKAPNAPELPGIGGISEEEDVRELDVDRILKRKRYGRFGSEDEDYERDDFEPDFERYGPLRESIGRRLDPPVDVRSGRTPPAWYCPARFFGANGGIYIRRDAIEHLKLLIAAYLPTWHASRVGKRLDAELWDAAFLIYWNHEQYHHKVESVGFKLHVGGGTDRYGPYHLAVYRPTFLTDDCLEEALANCYSHDRLNGSTYSNLLSSDVRQAAQKYLRESFLVASPGYRRAKDFFDYPQHGLRRIRDFVDAQKKLQSQVFEGRLALVGHDPKSWDIAPEMSRALLNMRRSVYEIVPRATSSSSVASSAPSTKSDDLVNALVKHYGYRVVPGAGAGSHTKLKRDGSPTIIVSKRNRMFPGELNHILKTFGVKLHDLDAFLDGRFASQP